MKRKLTKDNFYKLLVCFLASLIFFLGSFFATTGSIEYNSFISASISLAVLFVFLLLHYFFFAEATKKIMPFMTFSCPFIYFSVYIFMGST